VTNRNIFEREKNQKKIRQFNRYIRSIATYVLELFSASCLTTHPQTTVAVAVAVAVKR
jgi:hypothetical protein